MSLDSPAIAILGAGPIGLESALYGRFLGYDVQVYEQAEVGHHILQWGHVNWFTPFHMNHSPLAHAALSAQDADWESPHKDAKLTGREYVEQFLRPLAHTDLLAESIHQKTEVISIGRSSLSKGDFGSDLDRNNSPFRLLLCDQYGHESVAEADIVIDATGVFGQHRFLGRGGLPALGEQQAAKEAANPIHYQLPFIGTDSSSKFAGHHTLVVGSGYSAATSIVALAQLAEAVPDTRITWAVRTPRGENGPLKCISDDPLRHRVALTKAANQLAMQGGNKICYLPGKTIESICIEDASDSFNVTLDGLGPQQGSVDVSCNFILGHTGFRPDCNLFGELQVQLCTVTEGPVRLAAHLLQEKAGDCMNQNMPKADILTTSEPNFYILGNKSYGRNAHFLLSIGLEQIQAIYALISGDDSLNLYKTIQVGAE